MTHLDLTLHGDAEEHDEVHHKDGPKHWHVKGIKERANHSDDDAFCRRMPELTTTKKEKYYSRDFPPAFQKKLGRCNDLQIL